MTVADIEPRNDQKSCNGEKLPRVAIVLSELRAGGMERVVVHLATGLAGQGLALRVYCLQSKGVLAGELENADVEVRAIGSNSSYDLKGAYRLATDLRKFRPDVINIHDYSSLPYAAIASMVRPRCPLVFTAHGLLYEGFEGKERRYRLFSRKLHTLTAVSNEVLQRHHQFLDWSGNSLVIPNGVPSVETSVKARSEVRHDLGIADDEFVFLAVGNPRPEKAFEDLIAASIRIRETAARSKFSVLIAGGLRDDEYCQNLQRLANESNLTGLRLLGFRSDIQRLYSAADSLVVSSRSEGLPMVILEAMMAGLPIVSTRVGGIPKALPPDCGRLVEPDNPEDLSNGLLELLNMDREGRKQMGRRAHQYADQHYGVNAMTARYRELFDDLKDSRTTKSVT